MIVIGTSLRDIVPGPVFGWWDSCVAGLAFVRNLPTVASYDIHGVRRGLGVTFGGMDIVDEGMGIGGPVGLYKRRVIFSLDAHDATTEKGMTRTFLLNGVSSKRIGYLQLDAPYKIIHNVLAPLYLRGNSFRRLYRFLMLARDAIGVKTGYSRTNDDLGRAHIGYQFSTEGVDVSVDFDGLDGGKLLIANELSGRLFTSLFVDGKRVDKIPPLTHVDCEEAILFSPTLHIGMTVPRVEGASLYAGREVLANRLNWAGLIYVLAGNLMKLSYRVRFFGPD